MTTPPPIRTPITGGRDPSLVDTNWARWFNQLPGDIADATGTQGVQGATGLQGPQGIPGDDGDQGVTGLQNFISDANTAPYVDATPIQILYNSTDDAFFASVNSTDPWIQMSSASLQGLQGETGIQGDTGLQGQTGIQGDTGLQGQTGIQGVGAGTISGTVNRVAKFTPDTTSLGNSTLTDTGTVVYTSLTSFGVGGSPSYLGHFQNASNSGVEVRLQNTNAGTSSYIDLNSVSDTAFFSHRQYSSGYSGSYASVDLTNVSMLYAQGNSAMILANQAANPIHMAIGGNLKLSIESDGDVHIRDYLGLGKSPTSGQLELYQDGCPSDTYQLLYNGDTTHGITDYAPTNAFASIDCISESYGGLKLTGLGIQTSENAALQLWGIADANCAGAANIEIIGGHKSGTGATTVGNTDSVLTVKNYTTNICKFLGSRNIQLYGDIYTIANTTHNPTIAGYLGGTAPTYSLEYFRYRQTGDLVDVWMMLFNSSGGTAGSGTNTLYVDLPVSIASFQDNKLLGHGHYQNDTTSGQIYAISYAAVNDTVSFIIVSTNTSLTLDDQNNANRKIYCRFSYEAA